ncbi:MAG: hypothetical protein JW732_04575 [Dehalococcoidia bacterium]|nr:hypothetical protein [Dehalococcoidia bacterium]
MSETRISQISDEAKERVKKIVKYHYGFTPKDTDIEWIDKMLRNNYAVLHEQQIIRELATNNISNELLKHRDRIGSIEFERIWLEKDIFKYLTFASMCFRAGISAGTISLCRTAIESGLRERLAEESARKENPTNSDLSEAILNKLKKLKDKPLAKLIEEAGNGIIKEQEIEKAFQELKFKDQSSRKILDKFIHGDITWIVSLARGKENIEVRGAEGKTVDKLEEYKIIRDMGIDQIGVNVLKATYRIAEILYYKNI